MWGKGGRALLGLERSWNSPQVCLLGWLASTSVLAIKSISPPSLVFAEVSGLFLCKEREFAGAVCKRILIFLAAFLILLFL